MAKTLRQLTDPDFTSKGATLTFSELDQNFIDIWNEAKAAISETEADNLYLRLDASNDPLTADLSLGSNNLDAVNNIDIEGYIDLAEIPVPSNPASGVHRIYSQSNAGFSVLHHVNTDGIDFEIGRDITHIARNESGATITKGTPVYISGSNGNYPTIEEADASSEATATVFGLVVSDVSNNSYVRVLEQGDLSSIDLSAYTEGDTLYLSTTAGQFTTTKPTGDNKVVVVGTVIKNTPSGILEVETEQPIDFIEPTLNASFNTLTLNSTPLFDLGQEQNLGQNKSPTFAGGTFNGNTLIDGGILTIERSNGHIRLFDTDGTVDERKWILSANTGLLRFLARADDYSGLRTPLSLDHTDGSSIFGGAVTAQTSSTSLTNFLTLFGDRNTTDTEVGILFKDRNIVSGGQQAGRIYTERQGTGDDFDLVFNNAFNGSPVEALRLDSVANKAIFSGGVDIPGALDVDGTTTLDGLTVAEDATFSTNVDILGTANIAIAEIDTLRTTFFKPNTIIGMGGKFVHNATTSVISINTSTNVIEVVDAVFANGDSVIVSSGTYTTGSGFTQVELNITSNGTAGSEGTNYDYTVNSGVDTDISADDTVVKVDGDMILVDAEDSADNPSIKGYDNLSGFGDSPLSGGTATPVWELNPTGGVIAEYNFDTTHFWTEDGSQTAGTYSGLNSYQSSTTKNFFAGADDKDGLNATFYVQPDGKLFYDGIGKVLYSRNRVANFTTDASVTSIQTETWDTEANAAIASVTDTDDQDKVEVRFIKRFGEDNITLSGWFDFDQTGDVSSNDARVYVKVYNAAGTEQVSNFASILSTGNTFEFDTDISSLSNDTYYYAVINLYATVTSGGSGGATTTAQLREDVFMFTKN